ncbi:MAG: ABC transporter ATP-binding protein [Clostridia bacterium]|nr:ABC transporter ATP-binding protein [Clostridia bacterium]
MFILKNIRYKNILSIDSLEIPSGKVTCITGESGSGKSTLLKLLNNLISPDEGEILFKGNSVDKINPVELRRKVVMLSQNPVIFDGTVKDNLLAGLVFANKQLPSQQRLSEVLEQVRLNKEFEQNADSLSGGEKQRLSLARVLLMDPEVFLLDEPSSSLDEATEHFIIDGLVNHTRQSGKTLIMVTHSKKVAEVFSDYEITIADGKVSGRRYK